MNQAKTNRTALIDAEIEAILAGEAELVPTSGFLASVMESVQQEASAPPPIPFPWKTALPGFLLAAAPVSYTHLDVYKRQTTMWDPPAGNRG